MPRTRFFPTLSMIRCIHHERYNASISEFIINLTGVQYIFASIFIDVKYICAHPLTTGIEFVLTISISHTM